MKIIGLTGGIGCGKTTVLKEFERLGVPGFVADEVAKEYYKDADFNEEIATMFGREMMGGDGLVDKARLARLVFADAAALATLNALIHPKVWTNFEKWEKRQQDRLCAGEGRGYVLFESAILFDTGFDARMDATVCVYLDREERIRRLCERDRCTLEAIEARMRCQLDADEMMRRADFVILNYEGNPRRRQVEYIDKMIIDI